MRCSSCQHPPLSPAPQGASRGERRRAMDCSRFCVAPTPWQRKALMAGMAETASPICGLLPLAQARSRPCRPRGGRCSCAASPPGPPACPRAGRCQTCCSCWNAAHRWPGSGRAREVAGARCARRGWSARLRQWLVEVVAVHEEGRDAGDNVDIS